METNMADDEDDIVEESEDSGAEAASGADDGGRADDDLGLQELTGEVASSGGETGDAFDDPPADVPDKPRSAQDLEAVYDIPVRVSAVLGKSSMQVNQLLKLGRGAVVELDRKVGEAIDIYVNDRLVARGEVVVVDERLGITMTEIIKTQRN
jgi:flagellar motor switch protein FliN/FliY